MLLQVPFPNCRVGTQLRRETQLLMFIACLFLTIRHYTIVQGRCDMVNRASSNDAQAACTTTKSRRLPTRAVDVCMGIGMTITQNQPSLITLSSSVLFQKEIWYEVRYRSKNDFRTKRTHTLLILARLNYSR